MSWKSFNIIITLHNIHDDNNNNNVDNSGTLKVGGIVKA